MATFRSDIHRKGVRIRGSHYGKLETASATMRFPIGTVLTSGDLLKFFILGGQTLIHRVTFMADQDLDPSGASLVATLGYLQRLKADAVTAENEGYDQNGAAIRPSPATNADAFLITTTASGTGAAAFDTLTEFLAATTARVSTWSSADFAEVEARDPDGIGGPVDFALTLTGSGTALVADAYLTCVIEYSGARVLPGSQPDYIYRDRYSATGVSSV